MNHAVLYVRDAEVHQRFYADVLGFATVADRPGQYAFMRASKSLYAKDPDGLEFEVMWLTPSETWGSEADDAIIRPLDIEAELSRFGSNDPS